MNKIMLCDFSTSMAGKKETALKEAIKDLVPRHPETALLRFGGHGSEVAKFMAHEVDAMRTGGMTPMGKALDRAWGMKGIEQIILITDGEPNDWTTDQILEEADEFYFIPIHIIGIGNPYALELNEPFLKELARITGGSYNRINEGDLYILSNKVEALLEYNSEKDSSVIHLESIQGV
jgi:Mg-chelatase subunit ChlD